MSGEVGAEITARLAQRAEREKATEQDWAEAVKPAKASGQQVRVLGANPQDAVALPNTSPGGASVPVREVPGGAIVDGILRTTAPVIVQAGRRKPQITYDLFFAAYDTGKWNLWLSRGGEPPEQVGVLPFYANGGAEVFVVDFIQPEVGETVEFSSFNNDSPPFWAANPFFMLIGKGSEIVLDIFGRVDYAETIRVFWGTFANPTDFKYWDHTRRYWEAAGQQYEDLLDFGYYEVVSTTGGFPTPDPFVLQCRNLGGFGSAPPGTQMKAAGGMFFGMGFPLPEVTTQTYAPIYGALAADKRGAWPLAATFMATFYGGVITDRRNPLPRQPDNWRDAFAVHSYTENPATRHTQAELNDPALNFDTRGAYRCQLPAAWEESIRANPVTITVERKAYDYSTNTEGAVVESVDIEIPQINPADYVVPDYWVTEGTDALLRVLGIAAYSK